MGPTPQPGLDVSNLDYRSEGFPLAAYSIPGREGRGPGQNPELFRRLRLRRLRRPEIQGPLFSRKQRPLPGKTTAST